MFSLVLKVGTIVDGTGRAPFVADVSIEGDRIVCIGKIEQTENTID